MIGWVNWYHRLRRDEIDLPTYRRTVRKVLQRRGWTIVQWHDLPDDAQVDEICWEWHLSTQIEDLMNRYADKKKLSPEVHALLMTKMWGL